MAEKNELKENKMGVMPVNKLLISMALPMMISMLVMALYNVVDSIFVSQINENALTAVSLAFPVQNLMIAIGSGTGVGINAYLSRSLGEQNKKNADGAANNGVFLALVSAVVFAVIGILFSGLFFEMQTNDEQIIEYGYEYLIICTVCSFGMFGQMTFDRLLQSTGKTFYTMITQATGAVINIILDPIFIFGYFGMPEMGVAGAAVATVIGQIIAMALSIYFNVKKNDDITLKLKGFRPDIKSIKRIYAVGLPSVIMLSISSVMTFCLNKILISFSSTATAVFGVYFKLQSFVFMPVFGLNNGMVPIISYNYGARKKERMTKTVKLSVMYAICIMIIGVIIFQFFPQELLLMFNASDDMLRIGTAALRIISISFIPAGFCIIAGSVFQALGNGVLSLVVSIVRQLVVLVPAAYILSLFGYVEIVWFAFPISEIMSVVLSVIFMRYIYTKEIKPMEEVL